MKNNKSFIFNTREEGIYLVVYNSQVNGDAKLHHVLVSKAEQTTGGEIVNIYTDAETLSVYSVSNLKTEVTVLLSKIAGLDIRDLNYNLHETKCSLKDAYVLVGDFAEAYASKKVKPLSVKFLKENLSEDFLISYDFKAVEIDNTLAVSMIPLDSSMYTSDEDKDNILFNKQELGKTKLPSELTHVHDAFKAGSHTCALFYGESSTGKSFASRLIARDLEIPVYSYNFAAGSDESFVQGKYAPREDEEGFTFLQNNFIKAYTEGGMFVAEELNYAYANVTGPLNSALDFLKKITLANEKQLVMHPNFRMITCINPGYEGTQPLNRALLSRQELVVRFEDLTDKEIVARIKDRCGYTNKAFVEVFANMLGKLNNAMLTQGIDGYASLREIESCIKLLDTTSISVEDAIKTTVINKVLLYETSQTYNDVIKIIAGDLKELKDLYRGDEDQDPDDSALTISNLSTEDVEGMFGRVDKVLNGTK